MLTRSAGVLLPVSALPGPQGIGTLGDGARRFIDRLSEMGFSWWQVLPLGPLDGGFSPYAGNSAFAGNPLLIDAVELYRMGLLTREQAQQAAYSGTPHTVDYAFAEENSWRFLRLSYAQAPSAVKKQAQTMAEDNAWLSDYSLFLALSEAFDGRPWQEWGAYADVTACRRDRKKWEESAAFYTFVQYLFDRQWASIQAYAHEKKVNLLGDIPVYVALNSSDVWADPTLFDLDGRGYPRRVAGVPPDYFAADGQLWGNPLYNWERMKETGYAWWVQRLLHAFSRYDRVRVDHFRGLASYWAVPAGAATAREGQWEPGPGMALFGALAQKCPNPPLVAEDLGTFGEDVLRLLAQTGFPGMRVLQFGFQPPGEAGNSHRPHNYPENTLAYTGTHDNNTLLGWLWEASPEEREAALAYSGYRGTRWGDGGPASPACRGLIECVWRSAARLAIVPVQDMCGFGRDTRMNVPGVPEKNWRYRVVSEDLDRIDRTYFRRLNELCGRAGNP